MSSSVKPLARRVGDYCAWHAFDRLWQDAQKAAFAAVAVAGVLLLADRCLYLNLPPAILTAVLPGLAVTVVLVRYLTQPRRLQAAAYRIDRAAGLHNLVASALDAAPENTETARVLQLRAENTLARFSPARIFPLRLNRWSRLFFIPALLLIAAGLCPRMDLLARHAREQTLLAEHVQVEKGALKLAGKLTSAETSLQNSLNAEQKSMVQDLKDLAKDLGALSRQDALQKLGEFEARHPVASGRQDMDTLARRLAGVVDLADQRADLRAPLQAAADALRQGDFRKTRDALRDLGRRMDDNKLNTREAQALARELGRMADALRECGLKGSAADLLRSMAASSEDLNELLKQCKRTASEMESLCQDGEGLQAMRDGLNEAKKAMLGEGFTDFEARQLEQLMAKEAHLAELGIGFGDTGGQSHGRGGQPPEQADSTEFEKQASPSRVNKGRVVAEMFVSGAPDRGVEAQPFAAVVREARQEAAGALAREHIPREYEAAVKRYFESLDKPADSAAGADTSETRP